MLKKILFILLIVVISGAGGYFYFLSGKRLLIKPYPYLVMDYKIDDQALAEKASVLIIGDRMGKVLDKEIPALELSTKLPIYNWAKNNEGLHRTLYKLKKLKKFPPIIIYHGASEELFEKKFHLSDKEKIGKNFATYDDDKIISLIITFPILSQIFYSKLHYIDLKSQKENKEITSPAEKLNQKELSFLLYQQEIRDLIELARQNKSKLIFITTPINYHIAPKETCAHAITPTIGITQNEIEKLIAEGKFKEAYAIATKLSEITLANAQSFYLLGKSATGAGEQQKARIAFQKASVFDCLNWRGSAVYNSILISEGRKNQVHVIDFDLEINSTETSESAASTFFDEIFPQNIFYQSLAKELGETINIISAAIK
jgi:hypothetical protein